MNVRMKAKPNSWKLEVLKKMVKVGQKLVVIKNPGFSSDRAEFLTQRSFRSYDLNEPEKSGLFWFFDHFIREKPVSRKKPEIWKFLRKHVLILLLTNGISAFFAPLGFFEKSKSPVATDFIARFARRKNRCPSGLWFFEKAYFKIKKVINELKVFRVGPFFFLLFFPLFPLFSPFFSHLSIQLKIDQSINGWTHEGKESAC